MWSRVGMGALLSAAMGYGCSGPALDVPEPAGMTMAVDFEPAANGASVALSFRARLRGAPASGSPWLFRGELSDHYTRSLKSGEIPTALRERAVPLRFWREGTDCWLQPLEWLEPELSYTLSFTGLGIVRVVQANESGEPRALRVFPPPGADKHRVAVFCGLDDEAVPEALSLEPGAIEVRAAAGQAGQPAPGCLTMQVQEALTRPVVAPAYVAGALLEASPWLPPSAGPAANRGDTCNEGQLLHGACLQVLADRLRVTPLDQDLFFALEEPRSLFLSTKAGSRSLLVRGLSPAAELTLGGTVLSTDGQLETFHTTLTTLSSRRLLVLNEVLANPLAPEPDAEWLELVNDSDEPASLADVWLEDSGAAVKLPEVELSAGEIALVVGDGFRASGPDVPIPEGVRLLRVSSLGARGLSNGGEALTLVGPEGVLSRFPSLSAPHAGRSMARRALDGADDDATGFAEHGGLGASPGAPNVLDD